MMYKIRQITQANMSGITPYIKTNRGWTRLCEWGKWDNLNAAHKGLEELAPPIYPTTTTLYFVEEVIS